MNKLNLSTRLIMFSICSSIEYDLKRYILSSQTDIKFSEEMIVKAKSRKRYLTDSDTEELLNQLDLGDYIEIIYQCPYKYYTNNENVNKLKKYFRKIIPIRNRVMHTKPLELGDRALLMEVISDIQREFEWINWTETIKTKEILETNPSKLMETNCVKVEEYYSNIYHNIPEPEFDDTGYIGRKREIKEIKDLINNKKNQIITIVGNGGIGKTAITVKTLYEVIDDPNCKYDAIIWVSLKTRTLSKGEFIEIEQAITNIPMMFTKVKDNIIIDEGLSAKQNLLNFLDTFNVLLVLDNLETVNNEEINSFIKQIPENSKVLITSRHGIGELEYRYPLEGMGQVDSLIYFRELSKYYGLDLHKKSDSDIKDIVNNELYSNPLSIKWFISGVYNGINENLLLSNKSRLIEFCMSNVFEKLSSFSKEVLQLFLIDNKELTYAEIDYFMQIDEVSMRVTMNELAATNMLRVIRGKYSLNEMARDYISLHHIPSNQLVLEIMKKRKNLNIILQDTDIHTEKNPFSPKSLFANKENENRKIASYYLIKALEIGLSKWEETSKLLEKAASVAPDYFEVYKIKAFLCAEKNELFEAKNNYELALGKCESDLERASVLYLFAVFYVIKLPEYEIALKYINESLQYYEENIWLSIEKSRILMYLGKYDEAEEILELIEKRRNEMDSKVENLFISRYADLYRRLAANYEVRDIDKKILYLKSGVEKIESLENIDTKTYLILINILKDLSFLFFNEKAMILLVGEIKLHFSELESIKHKDYKRMKDILISHKEEIPNNIYKEVEKYINDFKLQANNIYSENEGIIVFMKGHYGFISNANNSSIYFNSCNIVDNATYGDKVKFELYKNYKGVAARNIMRIT